MRKLKKQWYKYWGFQIFLFVSHLDLNVCKLLCLRNLQKIRTYRIISFQNFDTEKSLNIKVQIIINFEDIMSAEMINDHP